MQTSKRTAVLAVVALLALGALPALAQEAAAPDLLATVTLQGGDVLAGQLKVAEFGVVLGSGLGALQDGFGQLKLKVEGRDVVVPASDISAVDVAWAQIGTETEPKWVIQTMTITKKDGTSVVGQPSWVLQFSTLRIITADGEKRVHAFPLSPKEFNPNNLIKRLVLGTATAPPAPAPVEPAPAPVVPAPVEPAPAPVVPAPVEPAPAPVVPAPVEPAPAPVAPAPVEPAPAPVVPAPVEPAPAPVVPAPVEPAPAPVVPAPVEPAPAPVVPAPVEPAPAPVVPAPVEPAPAPVVPAPVEPAPAPVVPAPVEPAPAPVVPAPVEPANPIRAIFQFGVVPTDAEKAGLKGTLAAFAVNSEVQENTAADGAFSLTATLADAASYPALVDALQFRAEADGSRHQVFQLADKELRSSFTTVQIKGTVKMTVTFTVTPGATLFHSAAPGQETQVDAALIDATGNVTMPVTIAKGQEFVYARTVLGGVERCIKVDIFSGETVEITKAAYLAHS